MNPFNTQYNKAVYPFIVAVVGLSATVASWMGYDVPQEVQKSFLAVALALGPVLAYRIPNKEV